MSEIRANTISDAAGTGPIDLHKQSAAKAWVNFNGTGTVAVRESTNVSSLTDSSTGICFANYTNTLSSSDYAVTGMHNWVNGGQGMAGFGFQSSSGMQARTLQQNTFYDSTDVSLVAHGDLA